MTIIKPKDADIQELDDGMSVCLDTQGDNNEELIVVLTDKYHNHTVLTKETAYRLFVWLENHRLDLIMGHKIDLSDFELPD
jgi:hypothetical protein